MKNSQFIGAPIFQNVSFHNAKIIDGYFELALFIDTNFSNADLKGPTFERVDLVGNNVLSCKNNQICN